MSSHILATLAGEWAGEEQIATTRWGPGGLATSHISARMNLGDRVLVQDYRAVRDGTASLQAHAVFTPGPEHDQYGLYWFDSFGFVPASPAVGLWNGSRLSFVRSSPRGQTRHIYIPDGDDRFELTLESSFNGGVSWERVLTGSYRRTN